MGKTNPMANLLVGRRGVRTGGRFRRVNTVEVSDMSGGTESSEGREGVLVYVGLMVV